MKLASYFKFLFILAIAAGCQPKQDIASTYAMGIIPEHEGG
jgi:hypothetical protein